MNNYKGVLFDLDGTLADNYTAIHKCTCAVFTEYGVPLPSYEKVFKTVGGSILITMKRLLAGSEFENLYEKIADDYLKEYPKYVYCGLKAMPYAENLLVALKSQGVKLACFTNKQSEGAEQVLAYLGLDKYLDCTIATTLHSPRKPEKAFTEMALKALALDSCNVIGIGDSPFDYQAAQCCNIDSALVATGGDSKDFLIEKCQNAIGVFDNLKCLAKNVFDLEI